MTDRMKVKRFVKIWITLAFFVLIAGYATFQAHAFAQGPTITVLSPADGSTSSESLVIIEGDARNISYLTLDGNKIFTDESGHFKEKALLSQGYNIMKIEAQDRFGRKTAQTLQLIYK
jgi:hypothetical protein